MKNLIEEINGVKSRLVLAFMAIAMNHLVVAQVSPQERQALIDLYNSADGDNWTVTTLGVSPWLVNDSSSLVSDWGGVTVENGKVTKLVLINNQLKGIIPTSIGNLTNLTTFNLAINQLSGTLPDTIGDLINVETFSVERNALTGTIPPSIGDMIALKVLVLGSNTFSGNIPGSIGNLSNLTHLNLFINQLDGPIPPELGNLSSLTHLNLFRNLLVGNIPATFGNLSNLEFFNLYYNRLTGSIPSTLGNLSALKEFNIGNNTLSGNIPSTLGNLSLLTTFNIANNRNVSGVIPTEFEQLSNLKTFYVNNNKLEGSIPAGMGSLTALSTANFGLNNLSGKIPPGFSSLASQNVLNLLIFGSNKFVFDDFETEFTSYQNELTTFVYKPQKWVGQTESLSVTEGQSITLTSTDLTSPSNNYKWFKDNVEIVGANGRDLVIANATPADAGAYHLTATNDNVPELTLVRNKITLTTTPNLCNVSDLEKQALVDLYNATNGLNWTNNANWLTDAPVCDWFGVTVEDDKVKVLKLSNNNLSGSIPSSIGQLSNLIELRLMENGYPNAGIVGGIPVEIGQLANLTILDLSSNILSGNIPVELGNLTKLEELYLNRNKLMGTIPPEIGQLQELNTLFLEQNENLEGPLPNELANLSKLERLVLFDNKFSGRVPSGLVDLPLLSQLVIIQNEFVFSDFESEYDDYVSKLGGLFLYQLQANVDEEETLSVIKGQSITLISSDLTSPNNTYKWFKDNVEITGFSGRDLEITNATSDDAGEYHFTATNIVVDGLTLERNKITLNVMDIGVIQRFCVDNGDITIGDLQSPFSDGTASWFGTEFDKALILSEYVIPESGVYWAESDVDPASPRVPVQVILETGTPTGPPIQMFDEMDAPTVANLQAIGNDVQWYLSTNGEIPLIGSVPLMHNTYYYAAEGRSSCRLRVLVRFNDVNEDCNLLDLYVDGSFESCAAVASNYGHNGDVTCGQWTNGEGTADTWKIPFDVPNLGISNDVAKSPDGGIVAGGIARSLSTNELESFYAGLDGLEVGETYSVEFYQSNVTGRFDANAQREEARWKVSFGDQVQYSSYMVVTENPLWETSALEFVANSTEARLEFTASSANRTNSTSYVYMLIDGIRLSKLTGDGTGCPDDVVVEIQNFCSMIDDPTVGDLFGPEGVNDAIWFSMEVGGYQFAPEDLLLVGGVGIPSVDVYWAESSQFIGRRPVKVILDEGIPLGNTLQVFSSESNPRISDLIALGNNVQWYDSAYGQTPLQQDLELLDGHTYFAGHNEMECRLAVQVEIEIGSPDVEGIQVFCISDSPMVADLMATPSNPSFVLAWYASPEGGTPLSMDTLITSSGFYYVSQTGNGSTSDRISVYVSVISVPAPTGATLQTIYTSEGATLHDLVVIGNNIIWYDGDGVQLPLDYPLEEGGTYYAGQTDVSGNCKSIDRLAVTVHLEPELPPRYFSCEKFRPNPGGKYVVSGWVRESGVTISATETKNYSEISELFAKLLNELKDVIVQQIPVPKVYVPSPESREYDALVPFIKTSGINNLTIYDLKPVKEDQDGYERTVGFSFAFDEEGETTFTYRTPPNIFTNNSEFYSFPIIGNEDSITIDFTGVENCTEGLCVNVSFTYRYVVVIIPINFTFPQSLSISNILKESVDFNTYVPDPNYQVMSYANSLLRITYTDREGGELPDGATITFRPKGNVIDGWQRISAEFTIPTNAELMTISLQSEDNDLNVYFDDLRFHPFDGNMKTFVYDPITQRLQSELDENNYSTFYEYDREGGLIRVKKETERGVYTIQETRSGNSKLNN